MAAGMTQRQSPGRATEAGTVRFDDYWKATEWGKVNTGDVVCGVN